MEKPAYPVFHFLNCRWIFLIWIFMGCSKTVPGDYPLRQLEEAFAEGAFTRVVEMADSLKMVLGDPVLIWKCDSLKEISHRLRLEFSVPEREINAALESRNIEFTPDDLVRWEKYNLLESKWIDGEKYYFKRAASNLRLLLDHIHLQNNPDSSVPPEAFDLFRINDIQQILDISDGTGKLVNPRKISMEYKVTLLAGILPAGQLVRCWLPYPRTNHARQEITGFRPLNLQNALVSPENALHRTVFSSGTAGSDGFVEFACETDIVSHAQYFDLRKMSVLPYDTSSALYRKYTAQQPPHIRFTERIHDLSDEVVGDVKDPYEAVRRIFIWIHTNIPWTGALEYSVMPDIPGYVLDNMRGDCGMKTLLFMTLARYNGIPVRWQSGWMLHPGEVNLHDWCEVWYEGVGWVPVDVSFGLMPSGDIRIREFYITGIDAFRYIVNDDIMAPLIPEKKFFRSEPYDFQRGELEWDGGNLYFNQWKYHMKVSCL